MSPSGLKGQLHVKLETIPLAPLMTETWSRFAERATEGNLRASVNLDAAEARVDAALLRLILKNLFDNAVDYTPSGGVIEITMRHAEERPVIMVANSTSDLEPGDLPKMFDRFWRKESARSGGLHLGLGLSLSKAFTEAMHWSLTATLAEDRRIIFHLQENSTTSADADRTRAQQPK